MLQCAVVSRVPTHAGNAQDVETAAGFRPNRFQLIKVGYEFRHYNSYDSPSDNIVVLQLVTTFHGSAGRE